MSRSSCNDIAGRCTSIFMDRWGMDGLRNAQQGADAVVQLTRQAQWTHQLTMMVWSCTAP